MKTTILLITICLAIAGCSSKEQEQIKSLESVTNMPPDMHTSKKYIKLDPGLLAQQVDLSCGMSVKNKVVDTLSYNGKLYGFCGKGCKDDFARDPLSHLKTK